MTPDGLAWSTTGQGLLVRIRLQPGASREQIEGIETRSDGTLALRVRVTAPAKGGKANAALISLLAKALKLAKSDLTIVAGQSARNKTLRLRGPGHALATRLRALCGEGASNRNRSLPTRKRADSGAPER